MSNPDPVKAARAQAIQEAAQIVSDTCKELASLFDAEPASKPGFAIAKTGLQIICQLNEKYVEAGGV